MGKWTPTSILSNFPELPPIKHVQKTRVWEVRPHTGLFHEFVGLWGQEMEQKYTTLLRFLLISRILAYRNASGSIANSHKSAATRAEALQIATNLPQRRGQGARGTGKGARGTGRRKTGQELAADCPGPPAQG